jgi:hypothetical protein
MKSAEQYAVLCGNTVLIFKKIMNQLLMHSVLVVSELSDSRFMKIETNTPRVAMDS